VALYRQPLPRACVLGLATGLVYFTGTLYWITRVMVVYGGLSGAVAVLVNAALIAYLSLFPVIFTMVMARLTMAGGARALLLAPLVWVATELGRTHLFTGFPWVLLGYSQVTVLPVAQLASVFGVYGLSALVVSMSAALAVATVGPSTAGEYRTGTRRRGLPPNTGAALAAKGLLSFAPVVATAMVVLVISVWGGLRVRQGELIRGGDVVRVGLLQGNVDQADKWNDQRAGDIFRRYLEMTRQAVAQGARFVLWPESATPYPIGEDLIATDRVRSLARDLSVPVLIGSDQIVRGPPAKYYNAAFLIRPDGADGGVYRKMHLVPFGEYVPLRRVFFFASRLVQAVSDFSAGDAAVVLHVDEHLVSTAICYEIVYPDLVRQFVRSGSELLTTITNDAWFGPTSAPYQHFAQASMRAIENGRYLVRAANTGITGIVDPYGHVTARTGLYEAALVVGEARFLKVTTIYTRTGDLFAYGCTVATALFLVLMRRSGTMKS
jgi:apolipoprotein N-acyltransferase